MKGWMEEEQGKEGVMRVCKKGKGEKMEEREDLGYHKLTFLHH